MALIVAICPADSGAVGQPLARASVPAFIAALYISAALLGDISVDPSSQPSVQPSAQLRLLQLHLHSFTKLALMVFNKSQWQYPLPSGCLCDKKAQQRQRPQPQQYKCSIDKDDIRDVAREALDSTRQQVEIVDTGAEAAGCSKA